MFLKSPEWTLEICDWIDDNCIQFAGDLLDENCLEATDLHNRFRKIVDLKLELFCQEYGISSDTFMLACDQVQTRQQMKCLDQLIACENFIMFKRMMISRNQILNQRALRELQNQGEHIPESVNVQADYDAEEAELQRAIEESKLMMQMMEAAHKEQAKPTP